MSRAVMQQALEYICGAKLCEINSMSSRVEMVRLMDSAITALRAALAEPEQEPVESISAEQLSKMFQRLEGIDQNQWGYHWRCGWNDALREAMDYCQAAPTPRRPLSESELEALWDKAVDHMEHFCSQYWDFARAIERAHGITGEGAA